MCLPFSVTWPFMNLSFKHVIQASASVRIWALIEFVLFVLGLITSEEEKCCFLVFVEKQVCQSMQLCGEVL